MLIGWQDPPAWDPATGVEVAPPGCGNFLVKVGGRPGIPMHVSLTSVEREINDTNRLWRTDPVLELPPPDPATRVARAGVDG